MCWAVMFKNEFMKSMIQNPLKWTEKLLLFFYLLILWGAHDVNMKRKERDSWTHLNDCFVSVTLNGYAPALSYDLSDF